MTNSMTANKEQAASVAVAEAEMLTILDEACEGMELEGWHERREYKALKALHARLSASPSPTASAAQQTMMELGERLFAHIAHGDDQHRAWLKAELEKWFADPRNHPAQQQGERVAESLACGHHSSLAVRNVESGAVFCEYCYCHERMRDAESAEESLTRELTEARRELAEVRGKVLGAAARAGWSAAYGAAGLDREGNKQVADAVADAIRRLETNDGE